MADMPGYYHQEDLPRFAEMGNNAPELWRKFSEWYGAVFAEGALSEREKCLIALGVAHAVQCPYCIDAYTEACLEKGSNLEQMTEAVHVASAIRGGASLVHGLQMRTTPPEKSACEPEKRKSPARLRGGAVPHPEQPDRPRQAFCGVACGQRAVPTDGHRHYNFADQSRPNSATRPATIATWTPAPTAGRRWGVPWRTACIEVLRHSNISSPWTSRAGRRS